MNSGLESEPWRTSEFDDRLRPIDNEVWNLSQIEEERDLYYNRWKEAEKSIREIRSSLMWRGYKAATLIRRVLGRPMSHNVADSLVEAIEARPPEDSVPKEKFSSQKIRPVKPRRAEPEIDLEARLARASFERGGYHGEWRHAENRLREIRTSDLWRRWKPYRRFHDRLGYFIRTLQKGFVSTFILLKSAIASTISAFIKLPGTIYTMTWSALTTLRSKLHVRTKSRSQTRSANVDRDSSFRPRVLIVSPYHIHPPNHGSGVRLTNLIRSLADSSEIYVLIFSLTGENPEERAALEPYCARVDYHRWIPQTNPDRWGLRPAIAGVFRSDRAAAKIRDIVQAFDIDIVQLDHAELSQYRSIVPSNIPVILTEHDIAFRSHRRRHQLRFHTRFKEAQILKASRIEIMRLFRYEIRNCRRIQQIHMMSEVDASYLSQFLSNGGTQLLVAPNGVNTEDFRTPESAPVRHGVLFVGSFNHLPNVDALEFLVNDIWPLVRLRVQDAQLTIVGANPSPRVRSMTDRPGITLAGEVPDPRTYYHRHRVMVAPIRAGSGTRLKILEAFAAGIPVVSTSLGAEGIAAEDGRHIIIADRAMDFASAIERLLTDDSMSSSLAGAAAHLVRERYDWRHIANRVRAGYMELLPDKIHRKHRQTVVPRDSNKPKYRDEFQKKGPMVSIVIPTLNGGSDLERCLLSISNQATDFEYEIVCIDSGSSDHDLAIMRRHGVRLFSIDPGDFNHGFTRDLGASHARGEFLVFLSQDAVPVRDDWLRQIIEPLRCDASGKMAAVQGGSAEVIHPDRRFFWGCAGPRFYFTCESNRWVDRFGGIGFSTANCAIRRIIWDRYRFGWAPILEDKKWHREIIDAGYKTASLPDVRVFHSHYYGFRSLIRRCASEGYGWRLLGEHYRLIDAISDVFTSSVWRELRYGLQQKEARSSAEITFPLLRPAALWWGNQFLRRVLH